MSHSKKKKKKTPEPLKSHSVKPLSSIPNKNRIHGAGPDIKKAFCVVDIHPPEIHLEALEVNSRHSKSRSTSG